MKRLFIIFISWISLSEISIIIENGKAKVRRGNVRLGLKSELEELSHHNKINMACINAQTTAEGFRLSIYGVPKELQQRFRNVWGVNWR